MLPYLKELLDDATAHLPGVRPRRAFGSWGFYVDERMFALAYGREDRLGVKLPDDEAFAAARDLPGAALWAPHGAPMSGWVLLPADLHDDRDALARWVERACRLVRAAPAEALRKSAKTKATKKTATKKNPTKKNPTKKNPTKKNPTKKNPTKKNPTKKTATKKNATKKNATKKTPRSAAAPTRAGERVRPVG
jgi:TfoX/Sxy family transcriptional regulator of competence genes